MKSESERGRIGAWLVRERSRLGWKAEEVALRAEIPEASYRAMEAGRWQPTADRLARLEAVLGSQSPDTSAETPPPWAEALDAKVTATQETVERIAEMLAALAAIGRAPIPPSSAVSPDGPAESRPRDRLGQ